MRLRSPIRLVVAALAIIGLAGVAAATCATMAADLVAARQGWKWAQRLRPDDGSYYRQQTENPNRSAAERKLGLQRAVQLNPFDTVAWGELADADFELTGTLAAETDIRQGLIHANNFPLRYRLANLERVDGNLAASSAEMQSALAVLTFSDSNPNPARQELDSALAQVIAVNRDDRDAVVRDLAALPGVQRAAGASYLTRAALPQQALAIWRTVRCSAFSAREAAELLPDTVASIAAELTTQLVHAASQSQSGADMDAALQVWNGAVKDCHLAQAPIVDGEAIADSGFSHPWAANGFAWRDLHEVYLELVPGRRASDNAIHLALSGNRASDFDAFAQWIALTPDTANILSCAGRSDRPAQGFELEILVNGAVAYRLPLDLGSDWKVSQGQWRTPAGVHLAEVHLAYHRQPGDAVYQGDVWVADTVMKTSRREGVQH